MKETISHKRKISHPGIFSLMLSALLKVICLNLLACIFLMGWFLFESVSKGQMLDLQKAQNILLANNDLLNTTNLYFPRELTHSTITIIEKISNNLPIFNYSRLQEITQLIMTSVEIDLSRLAIFSLAIPLFLIVLLVCVTDGLVKRDIRKFQGARESTLVFHRSKRFLGICFFIPLFIYLSFPWSVSPFLFLGMQAMLLGFFTTLTISNFKKYL